MSNKINGKKLFFFTENKMTDPKETVTKITYFLTSQRSFEANLQNSYPHLGVSLRLFPNKNKPVFAHPNSSSLRQTGFES